jgi:hypothetical protein
MPDSSLTGSCRAPMLPRKLGAEGGAPVILAFCLPRGQHRVARPISSDPVIEEDRCGGF